MGWQIGYPLGGRERIEIRAWDESKTYKVGWGVIELRDEREWREFLEEVMRVGKLLGWEEK